MPDEQIAQKSFQERKAEQLAGERVRTEQAEAQQNRQPDHDETSNDEIPLNESESVQDDGYPELHDDDTETDDGEFEQDEDLEDETPSEDELLEQDGDGIDWEKRYKDAQRELTRYQQRSDEQSEEVAETVAANLQLKFDLEDRLEKAEKQAGFFMGNLNQQIQQLEQAFNQGQVEPEKMAEARQYYQGLVQQRNQLEGYLQQVGTERSEAEKVRKNREAQIAQARLRKTIPDWSERKYQELRSYAVKRGYTVDEFNESTDYRYMELLHDSMMLHSADSTVRNVKRKRRRKPPAGGKNVDRSPNTARRREARAKKDFLDNPNQRGRFAAMKAEQLHRERRR
jgi:hypothetical protein